MRRRAGRVRPPARSCRSQELPYGFTQGTAEAPWAPGTAAHGLFESVAALRAGFLERVGGLFALVVEALFGPGGRNVLPCPRCRPPGRVQGAARSGARAVAAGYGPLPLPAAGGAAGDPHSRACAVCRMCAGRRQSRASCGAGSVRQAASVSSAVSGRAMFSRDCWPGHRNQLVDGRVDRGILSADAHTGDEAGDVEVPGVGGERGRDGGEVMPRQPVKPGGDLGRDDTYFGGGGHAIASPFETIGRYLKWDRTGRTGPVRVTCSSVLRCHLLGHRYRFLHEGHPMH